MSHLNQAVAPSNPTQTQTFTQTNNNSNEASTSSLPSTSSTSTSTGNNNRIIGTLKLRGKSTKKTSVKWTEEVIDNEFMNKKKSKSEYL